MAIYVIFIMMFCLIGSLGFAFYVITDGGVHSKHYKTLKKMQYLLILWLIITIDLCTIDETKTLSETHHKAYKVNNEWVYMDENNKVVKQNIDFESIEVNALENSIIETEVLSETRFFKMSAGTRKKYKLQLTINEI